VAVDKNAVFESFKAALESAQKVGGVAHKYDRESDQYTALENKNTNPNHRKLSALFQRLCLYDVSNEEIVDRDLKLLSGRERGKNVGMRLTHMPLIDNFDERLKREIENLLHSKTSPNLIKSLLEKPAELAKREAFR
jgi:hypothetical protein